MQKLKIFLMLLLLLQCIPKMQAQKGIVSSGGNATGTGGNVSYSIGQMDYITENGAGGIATQGVQQPFEIFTLTLPEQSANFTATLFPNPTATSVILSLDFLKEGSNLEYELTDVTGKIIVNNRIYANETIIDVERYAQACYFVNILVANKRVKTFKLLKNN
jgi:hypothetical protein